MHHAPGLVAQDGEPCLSHVVGLWARQDCCIDALHLHCIKGADDGQVKPGADPHGVGIDQFLADVGATVASNRSFDWVNTPRIFGVSTEFLNKVACAFVLEEVGWLLCL